jgi:hypothetical protein
MIVARSLSINAIKADQFRLFALSLAREGVPICRRPMAEALPLSDPGRKGNQLAAVAAPLSAASAALPKWVVIPGPRRAYSGKIGHRGEREPALRNSLRNMVRLGPAGRLAEITGAAASRLVAEDE